MWSWSSELTIGDYDTFYLPIIIHSGKYNIAGPPFDKYNICFYCYDTGYISILNWLPSVARVFLAI